MKSHTDNDLSKNFSSWQVNSFLLLWTQASVISIPRYPKEVSDGNIMNNKKQSLKYLALNTAYPEAITEQFLVIRELHVAITAFKSRGLWKMLCSHCLHHRLGIMLPRSFLYVKSFCLALTHPCGSQKKTKPNKQNNTTTTKPQTTPPYGIVIRLLVT